MPAPLLASSHEMAAAMRAEASVSEIIRMAALSAFTLVGIGAVQSAHLVLPPFFLPILAVPALRNKYAYP